MEYVKNRKSKRTRYLRVMITFIIGLVLLGLVAAFLLHMNQKRNTQVFNSLIQDNLISAHQGQTAKARSLIGETRDLMESIAAVYNASGESPESAWSQSYLDAIRELDNLYDLQYAPAEDLQGLFSDPETSEEDKDMIQRLFWNQTVISDVFCPSSQGDACIFSVAVPVRQRGEVIGAFRSLVMADALLQEVGAQDNSHVNNYLLYSSGDLVLSDSEYLAGTENIFDKLRELGISENEIEAGREALEAGEPAVVALHSQSQGELYLMSSRLGYNDWALLSIAHSSDASGYTSSIMRNTSLLVSALIAFLLLLIGSAAWFFYQQKRRTQHNQARYDILARFSDTILFEYDCLSQTLVFTPNVADHYTIQVTDAVHPLDERQPLAILHPEDAPALRGMLRGLSTLDSDQIRELDLRFQGRDGQYHWMRCQGQLIRDRHGRPLMLIGKFSDIHHQKSEVQQLIRKSTIDAMTGALNREATEERIVKSLGRAAAGFFFMLDVDDFKKVNDTLGHSEGDRLLRQLVNEIKKEFRQNDAVGRIGGDEFVIFMENVSDPQVASYKAGRLIQRLTDTENAISVSIGIAAYPADGDSYTALYKAADSAMYLAKRNGKNGYFFAGNIQS